MLSGVLFVFSACFVWGLFFVAPQFLETLPIDNDLGKYGFGIIIIAFLFILSRLLQNSQLNFSIWKKALFFALFANIVYYTGLIIGLKFSSASVTALIMGISPITISLYANIRKKEMRFRNLLLPSVLIFIGLILVNLPTFQENTYKISFLEYFSGLIASFSALLAWTWFVVHNSKFLKEHTHISPSKWSTVIACSTMFWVIFLGSLILIFGKLLSDYFIINDRTLILMLGCSILGIVCSWLGSYLWNRASALMPLALAGQLMIFETIFGLTFIYLLEHRWPLPIELMGVLLMLSGILTSYYSFKKTVFVPVNS